MVDHRRRVWRLTVSRVLAMGGSMAAYAALTFTVYDRTHSTIWLAAATFATISLAGLITPLSGALADRYDRKRLMVLSDLAVAVAYVALVLLNSPPALVVLGAVASIAASPFIPASRAAIPNLVPPEDLTWANSMVQRAMAISFTGGPVVGGLLLDGVGVRGVFALAAAMSVCSALLVAGMTGNFADRVPAEGEEHHYIGDALEGFRYVARHRLLRALVIAEVVAFGGVGFAVVADAPLATQFGAGEIGYGFLLATWGVGSLIGATLAPRLTGYGDDLQRVIVGMVMIGVSIGSCWVLPTFGLILAVSVIGGAGSGVSEVFRQTLLQTHTPDVVRGRVFAAAEGVASLSFAASFLIAAPVVARVGPQAAYGICGILFTSGAVVVALLVGFRQPAPETA
jgi:MFS family permease